MKSRFLRVQSCALRSSFASPAPNRRRLRSLARQATLSLPTFRSTSFTQPYPKHSQSHLSDHDPGQRRRSTDQRQAIQ
ncbi:hypothetical protein DB330_08685 [Lacticaseibacillus casei]|nr:hypothetical protein [Lacticaseibacillus casei]PTU93906.1 hypothetical protein DB330_08685 [Lacticaseibacillus casei]PTU94926.1 hypothetical protein DB326_08890 [Lacticaseibacillus casei]RXS56902.1 hypothetical protein ETB94_08575 [Lacticaseibacillus casei]TLF32914.1 hypothetical protein FEI10_08605 [Lacticaseibacillus casei]